MKQNTPAVQSNLDPTVNMQVEVQAGMAVVKVDG